MIHHRGEIGIRDRLLRPGVVDDERSNITCRIYIDRYDRNVMPLCGFILPFE